jgi:hypothetical protein
MFGAGGVLDVSEAVPSQSGFGLAARVLEADVQTLGMRAR